MEKFTDATKPITDFVEKTTEATIDFAEKGIKAIDPLHLFAPNPNPTRLVLEEGLFSRTGVDYPILQARSNDAFHDLVVKGKTSPSNELVLQDAKSGKPVLVLIRTPEPRIYDIYKTSPMSDGQQPAKTNADLYLRAKSFFLEKCSKSFWKVKRIPRISFRKHRDW